VKVGLAGLGAIGTVVARALDNGDIPGMELVAVCAHDQEKAKGKAAAFKNPVPVVAPLELAEISDVVVECVPKVAFPDVATPALEAGRVLVTVSGAGLLANPDIREIAHAHGGQIILATGAILGLDAIRAAAEGTIHSVRMVTRKPPKSLAGAPHLVENNISIENLSEAKQVFKGTATEGARGFPANVNVAAAVGMAGIGADNTSLEIWADPGVSRNTHTVILHSDSARVEMTIENIPSEENPGTGKITALSVIAALRGIVTPFRVGT